MQVTIDLASDDTRRWHGGPVGWADEPISIEDAGDIVLHLGSVDVHLSYGQFEMFLDGILRWRWSYECERDGRFTEDAPPPSWIDHVRALAEECRGERHTIAADLEAGAANHGTLPGPEKGDKAALRAFVAGRSAGMREGLLRAAALIRERSKRLDPPPRTEPKPVNEGSK